MSTEKWFYFSEAYALDLYRQGFSIRKIEGVTGINRKRLSKLFSELGYQTGKKVMIDEASAVLLYQNGSSMAEVGRDYGISTDTVRRILTKHGVEIRSRVKELPEDEVIDNYMNRPSLNYWGGHYKVDPSVIKRVLMNNNVEVLSQSEAQRKYKYNHRVFKKIDTEEKAYWLGFMFADGSVSANRDDVTLHLAEKDSLHVEKFADFIGYSGEVEKAYISLRSSEMKSDLIYHGCVPRKSTTDTAPHDLPAELRRHFARGVCDGDGYVGVYKKSASIEIVGGRHLLLWLSDNGLSGDVRPHKSIWRLRSNTSNVLEWGRFMYGDSSVYLDRKYKSYLKMESVLNDK